MFCPIEAQSDASRVYTISIWLATEILISEEDAENASGKLRFSVAIGQRVQTPTGLRLSKDPESLKEADSILEADSSSVYSPLGG